MSLPADRQTIHIEQLRKTYNAPANGEVHYIIKDVDLVMIRGGEFSFCLVPAAAENQRY